MYNFFFFSSRRRHTRCREVSWARRCVQETVPRPTLGPARIFSRNYNPDYRSLTPTNCHCTQSKVINTYTIHQSTTITFRVSPLNDNQPNSFCKFTQCNEYTYLHTATNGQLYHNYVYTVPYISTFIRE
eukprot:TRINITY_DN19663_c0_g1_i3.p1 TRINITY_DN19663_c0_g1~~TRINITY_DN19663_c0_g1_i3.p1  ORF type:complete len:129 (+),score=10.67 TRINITY_DN19663_c0_g1_i3:46-432(+)